MNSQEKAYFASLSKDRAEIANVLDRPAVRGYKDSVVEKYSDQAHFIYELLQNADDACATKASFILEKNRLIFAHNGSRLFSVSDPNNEDFDSKNNTLGDINAITSIANSNKTGASIGKFGVGFKAVFQYTTTPHIYDPNFKFKIEKFIVPIEIDDDFSGRKSDETLFVFPFNHPDRKASEAYSDIADKLRSLSFPLLFLSHLENIEFEIKNSFGMYRENKKETIAFDDTLAERITLTQKYDRKNENNDLWLFSRQDDYGRKYSVGFFMDDEERLRPINEPAFCFFPTKEVTNLNFIIHAPFLLTDSREGIRAGVAHNDRMIKMLADLAADALVYLRDIGVKSSNRLVDDHIVDIIPVDEDDFSDPADKRKVSFLPFYESIKHKFKSAALIPTFDDYVMPENAYWAAVTQLTHLFSNSQLSDITENIEAQWAFVSLGRDELMRNNRELFEYIDSLVCTNLNEDVIINGRYQSYRSFESEKPLVSIKGITESFIESQEISWLHEFYKWLSDTKHRTEIIETKPIFLNQNKEASAAFDSNHRLILFLPVKDVNGYNVVYDELLEEPETLEFIKSIGVQQPSLWDQIYNIILPQYENSFGIVTRPHFKILFNYYCECPNAEVDEYIKLIKNYKFLLYNDPDDGTQYREKASSLYLPTPELVNYFETKKVKFVALDDYIELVGLESKMQLISFLEKLGVNTVIQMYTNQIDYCHAIQANLPNPRSTRGKKWEEPEIDGCKEILEYIDKNKDENKSVILWNNLLKFIEKNCNSWRDLNYLLTGKVSYFYRTDHYDSFQSLTAQHLKSKCWLKNKDGEFCDSRNLYRDSISDIYDTDSLYANQLMDFLGIKHRPISDNDYDEDFEENISNLTDEQREKIEFADRMEALGIKDDDDLAEFLEYKQQKEAKKHATEQLQITNHNQMNADTQSSDIDEDFDYDAELFEETREVKKSGPINNSINNVMKDIAKRTKEKLSSPSFLLDEEDADEDEYMPSSVDYSKKIERAKQKSAAEINKITLFEELQSKALSAEKYSYGWFTTLLEMESIQSGEGNLRSREVSISFAKVEREPGTKRTLVLKHPNQYIPQFMEDLADIPLVLHIGNQTKTIAIEVASIKSYTLRVKMKSSDAIKDIDLNAVSLATIDARSPAFLLEELRKQFAELAYDKDFNMQENLCENIEFVFGPPGTGKTTYLAKKVLIPIMKKSTECKILVLTPTNKSADVLVKRIMEVSGNDDSYCDWLVRFGATGDEEIEQSQIFRDKSFDIRSLSKSVTITTIARFPYDFFMPKGTRIFLHGMNWDYIVIDEASMIPLAHIIFPLYKKTPKKFIIAGDPFQIEPITSIELWKNENIYTMVHLDSFIEPETTPYQYKVKLLTTQYRSIPDIGGIFSNFAYGGILKHHRSSDSQRPLNVGDDLEIETLNVIKFPVSKYESIYRCKRLQRSSSYQVYSALFTFEYVCYLSSEIAKNNPGEMFRIGIIAPYRAQADMIEKLFASERFPKEIDVQVGTIHGFQGDECDIIFAVFNTPPSISASKDMFLNKKNIINVSISRARDYLFIIMPDDETENINNLRLVKRVESLIHSTDVWNEFSSQDLESLMFGDSKYLENNAFSTSHQSVNVYGLPEKIYEIRTEETAVDVQIHRESKSTKTTMRSILKEMPMQKKVANDSYNLNDQLIPAKLRKYAIDLPVRGDISGWYYLVPYDGKLSDYSAKKTVRMYSPQIRNGQVKMVSVSVIEKDRIIYIPSNIYEIYEQGLSDPDGIELKRAPY